MATDLDCVPVVNTYYLGLTGPKGVVIISSLTATPGGTCTGGQISTGTGCISPPFVCPAMNPNIPALGPTGPPSGLAQAQFNLPQNVATPIANAGTSVPIICAYNAQTVQNNMTPATVSNFFNTYGDVLNPKNENYTLTTRETFDNLMFGYCFSESKRVNQTTCPDGATGCKNVVADVTNCDKSSQWYSQLDDRYKACYELDLIASKIPTPNTKLSGKDIGIIVGVTLGVILIVGIGIYYYQKRKNKSQLATTGGQSVSTTVAAPVQSALDISSNV